VALSHNPRLAVGAAAALPITPPARTYGFFGRRKGHRLRPHQADLLTHLLPRLSLKLTDPAPVEVGRLFPGAVDEVFLEIGFGGGEHLLAEALRRPHHGLVGCEPFVNGMAKLLAGVAAQGVENVRVHLGDGLAVANWLPPASLAGIFILYPDPWPKRRHGKRRLIQDATVATLARPLRSGAFVRLATDSADYAGWILERFARSSAFRGGLEYPGEGRQPWPDFPGTRYGAKALREGRASRYLTFRRV
jgi:tRNA (guanine-N7-)-methyltransferase